MNRVNILTLVLGLMLLAGCASHKSTVEQTQRYEDPKDPLESFNRIMWDFNYEILDEYVLRPTAVAYVEYMSQICLVFTADGADDLLCLVLDCCEASKKQSTS